MKRLRNVNGNTTYTYIKKYHLLPYHMWRPANKVLQNHLWKTLMEGSIGILMYVKLNKWSTFYTYTVTPCRKFIIASYVGHEPNSIYDRGLFWSFSFSVCFDFASACGCLQSNNVHVVRNYSTLRFQSLIPWWKFKLCNFINVDSILSVVPFVILLDFDGFYLLD